MNITDIRYTDDAVLVAGKRKKMQKMVESLNNICRAYGMEIIVKKPKVMIMGIKERDGVQQCIMLGSMPLEQVTRFKYLGSWIRKMQDVRWI